MYFNSCHQWGTRLVSNDIKMVPEPWLMSAHVANDQKITTVHILGLKGWPLKVPWPSKAVKAITH